MKKEILAFSAFLLVLACQEKKEPISPPLFEQIKEDFLNGRTHKNCKKCQDAEKNGGYASLRSHYNKHYPSITDFNLKFIDVRWNNKCNLSCVYCSEEFSSTWEKKKKSNCNIGEKKLSRRFVSLDFVKIIRNQ